MDYKEYLTVPEGLEYERADAEQQRVLRMINERDKTARIFALGMVILLGIAAVVSLYLFMGLIAGIAALAFSILLLVLVGWYLAKVFPQKGYYDFEIVPMEVVSTEYHAGDLRAVDLWSEEQQKCVHYVLIRAGNHIHKDVKGFFVRAVSDKQKDYIFITEHEYKIMKMNADNRRN